MILDERGAPPDPRRHPHHDDVARELHHWFTSSAPEIGRELTSTDYGFLSSPDGPTGASLVLELQEPGRVDDALAAARAAFAGHDVRVLVVGHARAETLDPPLRRAGCRLVKATTYLALVDALRVDRALAPIEVEAVDPDAVEEWAITKIRCFDDDEAPPSPARLAGELSFRASQPAVESLWLARLGGEAAGVLAYLSGNDQLVFNLGTRVPFRHRGVAQALLGRWVDDGLRAGARSLVINATDPGRPAELYRRLGFVDEVYWYRTYALDAATATHH
jgi:Acetyltransferase (GNAT) family